MAIKVRRGLDADRLTVVFEQGEIAWTTDTQQFYVGDGVTLGGILIGPSGGAFVPLTRNLTINGTTFDLSADRTWSVGDVLTSGSYSDPAWITALAWSKITTTPTTLSGYGITDAQPLDATLTALAGLSTGADKLPYFTGTDTASQTDLTSFARTLLDDATSTAARSTLGLVIGTDVQAWDTDLDSWAAITRASGFDTFVATPSSANLRSLLTDETGTGLAYFQGGALGTPSGGTLTNCTGLPTSGITGYQGYSLSSYLGSIALAPADATTYYFGGAFTNALITTAAIRRLYIPKSGTIKAAYVTFSQTAGTAETSTISIRLNNTTDTAISAAITNDAAVTTFNNTGLSIAVVAGDYIEIKWVTPTWATNPTAVVCNVITYIE